MNMKHTDFDTYVLPTYKRQMVSFERGDNATLWDSEGKEYIHFLLRYCSRSSADTGIFGTGSFVFKDILLACRKTSNISIRLLYHFDMVFRMDYCKFLALNCRVGESIRKTFV